MSLKFTFFLEWTSQDPSRRSGAPGLSCIDRCIEVQLFLLRALLRSCRMRFQGTRLQPLRAICTSRSGEIANKAVRAFARISHSSHEAAMNGAPRSIGRSGAAIKGKNKCRFSTPVGMTRLRWNRRKLYSIQERNKPPCAPHVLTVGRTQALRECVLFNSHPIVVRRSETQHRQEDRDPVCQGHA